MVSNSRRDKEYEMDDASLLGLLNNMSCWTQNPASIPLGANSFNNSTLEDDIAELNLQGLLQEDVGEINEMFDDYEYVNVDSVFQEQQQQQQRKLPSTEMSIETFQHCDTQLSKSKTDVSSSVSKCINDASDLFDIHMQSVLEELQECSQPRFDAVRDKVDTLSTLRKNRFLNNFTETVANAHTEWNAIEDNNKTRYNSPQSVEAALGMMIGNKRQKRFPYHIDDQSLSVKWSNPNCSFIAGTTNADSFGNTNVIATPAIALSNPYDSPTSVSCSNPSFWCDNQRKAWRGSSTVRDTMIGKGRSLDEGSNRIDNGNKEYFTNGTSAYMHQKYQSENTVDYNIKTVTPLSVKPVKNVCATPDVREQSNIYDCQSSDTVGTPSVDLCFDVNTSQRKSIDKTGFDAVFTQSGQKQASLLSQANNESLTLASMLQTCIDSTQHFSPDAFNSNVSSLFFDEVQHNSNATGSCRTLKRGTSNINNTDFSNLSKIIMENMYAYESYNNVLSNKKEKTSIVKNYSSRKRRFDCYADTAVVDPDSILSLSCADHQAFMEQYQSSTVDSDMYTKDWKTDSSEICNHTTNETNQASTSTTATRTSNWATIMPPEIPAKYPESWVMLLQEWQCMKLDTYVATSVVRSSWPVSHQIRFSKRYRGIRMLRNLFCSVTMKSNYETNDNDTNMSDTINNVTDNTSIATVTTSASIDAMLAVATDVESLAVQLDVLRSNVNKTLSNHLLDFEKGDKTIQRRVRKIDPSNEDSKMNGKTSDKST